MDTDETRDRAKIDTQQAHEEARELLATAVGSVPPTDVQVATVTALKEAHVGATTAVIALVAPGRRRSIALTHLEESLMMSIKAVFNG